LAIVRIFYKSRKLAGNKVLQTNNFLNNSSTDVINDSTGERQTCKSQRNKLKTGINILILRHQFKTMEFNWSLEYKIKINRSGLC